MIIYIKKYRIYAAYEQDIIDTGVDDIYLSADCTKCPLFYYCDNKKTNDAILDEIIDKCSTSDSLEGINSEGLIIISITPTNMYKLFL